MGTPTTLFAISGSNDFARRRAIEQTVSKQRANGWDIQVVDGSDNLAFMSALYQSASMFSDGKPVLVVVHNPDKVPLPTLELHLKDPEPAATLLLSIEGDPKGNTKFGKFIATLDKKAHQVFALPDNWWDIPEFAAQFCVAEAKRTGHLMRDDLAKALVSRSGTDLGFLAFEMQKSALHAEARGSPTIDVEDVKAARAPIGEVSYESVKEALKSRNRKAVAIALERIRTSVRDPIMPLTGYIDSFVIGTKTEKEGKTPFGWLHLTTLIAKGKNADDIAAALNVSSKRCQYFMMPEVANWKPNDVIGLLKATAAARRAVVSGQIDPWMVLVSGILNACAAR